jgi:hypothetical protein
MFELGLTIGLFLIDAATLLLTVAWFRIDTKYRHEQAQRTVQLEEQLKPREPSA